MAASGDLGLFTSRANSCAIVAFDIGSDVYFVALACRVSAAPMRELGPGIFTISTTAGQSPNEFRAHMLNRSDAVV